MSAGGGREGRETLELVPSSGRAMDASVGPESFVLDLEDQLSPFLDRLGGLLPDGAMDALGWVLMELVSNAMLAPLGSALHDRLGLDRDRMLALLGTSAVWPGPRSMRRAGPERLRELFRSRVGMDVDDWLDLPLRERMGALGVETAADHVTVSAAGGPARLEVRVSSSHPPLPGDLEAARERIGDPAVAETIARERAPFEDGDGIFHMPSLTGGGGFGLICCSRLCRENGIDLEALLEGDPPRLSMCLSWTGTDGGETRTCSSC